MVFKPRQKRSICNIQISIDNQNIVKVKETNFLGVILDENLIWKSEISHVANKAAKVNRCSKICANVQGESIKIGYLFNDSVSILKHR